MNTMSCQSDQNPSSQ